MKYLKIANTGLIEVEALTLMGASTKDGKTTIGEFGSGNKYSLAYLLRNGYEVKIFVGHEQIEISTEVRVFRGHDFNVILINGKETSLTTEMGKDWELWQSVRELYCNAVDEGKTFFGIVDEDEVTHEETETAFYISLSPELEQLFFNINDYIALTKEVLFSNENGIIYRKHGAKAGIYRRGIKVFDTNDESIFDYDFPTITINESRVVKYSWEVGEKMWKLLFSCPNKNIIREVLQNIKDKKFIENQIDNDFCYITDSIKDEWVEAMPEKSIAPRSMGGNVKDEDQAKTIFLPDVLYNRMAARNGEMVSESFKKSVAGVYKEEVLSELENQILKDVVYFLKECKFDLPYEIKIVSFSNQKIMGSVDENVILLSRVAFDKGKQYVVNTIIEEYIHIKYGVNDETRAFQDASIDLLITYMKNINAFNF